MSPLDAVLAPRSIALIGANPRPGSVGAVVTRNLMTGGFAGRIMLVDPKADALDEARVRRIRDLPETPDLAVIATPAAAVPGVIADLGEAGCRAAIVITAGFEGPGAPTELRQAMLDAARPHGLRIVGPNCLGLLSPATGVNASFAVAMPPEGRVALVAQSGAVAAAAMSWAPALGLGFSHVVTVGDCADVDVADLVERLAEDAATDAILIYLEGLSEGPRFLAAARDSARRKPIAVLKAGRSAAAATAAFSHTGALAGAAAVYSAAFRRAGLLEVESLGELLRLGAAFDAGLGAVGRRLAILTNGGGAGVLAVDALGPLGQDLAVLTPETLAALDAIAPANWSRRNPIDILGDAPARLYGQALAVLTAAPEVDAALVLHCPTAVIDSLAAAEAVIDAARGAAGKAVLAAWLGGEAMNAARAALAKGGLPAFETPEDAARIVAGLAELQTRRRAAAAAPTIVDPPSGLATARAVVAEALLQGRTVLTDPEARKVLAAAGVPVVQSVEVATSEAAGETAARLGGPVALKILSRDISHKSDVGGVRLGLVGADETQAAAREMLAKVAAARPEARIDGLVVEPMVTRPEAQELLAGVVQDPTFGPVVVVGHGGVAVEVLHDRALGLPPLDDALAREMIARTRVAALLTGYRGRRPSDLAALSDVLVALGRLALSVPEIAELDINPLLCDADGVLALDARIAVRPGPVALRA